MKTNYNHWAGIGGVCLFAALFSDYSTMGDWTNAQIAGGNLFNLFLIGFGIYSWYRYISARSAAK